MKVFSVLFLASSMLVLSGCGEASKNKSEAAASAVSAVAVKELTPEEKFVETKRKAETGDADAQNTLGVMYQSGEGVPKDAVKAVEWYQKAASQGNARAQVNLGSMYNSGEGVPKDAVKAVEWYQKAAAQGNVDAQFNLGLVYHSGDGVPKDTDKAAEWYQKAAVQGDVDAQVSLGEMYGTGDGVPKDAVKAAEWFQKAAVQGHADAQYDLGMMYFDGGGVGKSMPHSYAWLNLSAAQGYAIAIEKRTLLEKVLTPSQITEGQRLASNWKKGDILQTSSETPVSPTLPNSKPTKQGSGTAFVVSGTGHALTNHHVINGCAELKVAGREGTTKVIASDSVNDIALLQLPGHASDIANLNADSSKLRQGDDILVFGYPLEWALSSGGNLTPGIISALSGLGNNTNQIQITAPIQPGSSGSPVMDKKGGVVGVVSMKLSDSKMAKATGQVGQNVNFAVNGQTVKSFLDANKVPYKTGGGFFSREKSNADIAEDARKFTVLLECWK